MRKEIENQLTNVSPLSHNPSSKSNHKLYKSLVSTQEQEARTQTNFFTQSLKDTRNKNKNMTRTRTRTQITEHKMQTRTKQDVNKNANNRTRTKTRT